MTINKKSSRRIKVRDDSYIWTVSPNDGYIIVIVEHEVSRGNRLEIYITSDIDSVWVKFPNTEHLNLKIVRPKDVEFFICQALDLGWIPKVKGKPVVFDFNGLKITRRLS
ncbi:hypothetical protein PC41400_17250 [Paenibacillus chitinolyticus]|uniref:Uncharacterized protein n=1 Tax=Paenibacillus chitinolyticus TaxID=79263 RepID=A0A410WYP1_9BACL|nr:hypothetical protein [Paenibacillus chitinolyticus]MCY9589953.1 hypothetical protein [Paenibacillus chitinolyticus]MCY9596290.1 hypothetical protein [Paenibacillus chitinolyticus]QAV19322.1 hypothetical protein PC41400_17250 [Paenibacillus chitinolyticus]